MSQIATAMWLALLFASAAMILAASGMFLIRTDGLLAKSAMALIICSFLWLAYSITKLTIMVNT